VAARQVVCWPALLLLHFSFVTFLLGKQKKSKNVPGGTLNLIDLIVVACQGQATEIKVASYKWQQY
jgi:F0F1-type ATP synthase membrane subunit a